VLVKSTGETDLHVLKMDKKILHGTYEWNEWTLSIFESITDWFFFLHAFFSADVIKLI